MFKKVPSSKGELPICQIWGSAEEKRVEGDLILLEFYFISLAFDILIVCVSMRMFNSAHL